MVAEMMGHVSVMFLVYTTVELRGGGVGTYQASR